MYKFFKQSIKYIVAIGLLAFFLFRTDFELVWGSFRELSSVSILIALLIYFVVIIVVSIKWKILLPGYPVKSLVKYNLIGIYYSTVLPSLITGEVFKSYRLGKGQKDAGKIIASVIVDKITGLTGMIIVGIMGLFMTTAKMPRSLTLTMAVILLIIVGILFSIGNKYVYNLFIQFLLFLARRLPRFLNVFNHIINSLAEWANYTKNFKVLIYSTTVGIGSHLLATLFNYLLAKDIGINVSFFDWCWIYGLMSLILLLPFTVAGIGLREGSLISLLGLFGVKSGQCLALSFTLLFFLLFFALLGLIIDLTIKKFSVKSVVVNEAEL